MKLVPLDDRVVIKQSEAEEKTRAESYCRMRRKKNRKEEKSSPSGRARCSTTANAAK